MTNEEAIDILSTLAGYENTVALILDYSVSVQDALHMAIKALEQQFCEDCISREAIKEMLTKEWTKYMPMELDMNLSFVLEKISELPSVTPKEKTGRWIDIMVGDMPAQACDKCNTFYPLEYTGGGHKYCPNCGAKMVEPQESEDKE